MVLLAFTGTTPVRALPKRDHSRTQRARPVGSAVLVFGALRRLLSGYAALPLVDLRRFRERKVPGPVRLSIVKHLGHKALFSLISGAAPVWRGRFGAVDGGLPGR